MFYDDTLHGLANPKQLANPVKTNNVSITRAIANSFLIDIDMKQKLQAQNCGWGVILHILIFVPQCHCCRELSQWRFHCTAPYLGSAAM